MPVERWSTAQVLAVAPDPAAARAARSVSGAAKWSASGLTGEVLWGLCKGSGKNPYQVCVDLSGPAYRCSCPSRKFPCKHALGLLLLWAESGAGDAEAPDWVVEWQAGRATRAARPPAGSGPADPAAAAKRAGQRATRVAAGLDELRRWLDDQVDQGLAGAEQAGPAPFEAVAARLVDAQAPAVAGTVRRVGRTTGIGAHWADRLLGELGLIRLLVTAHDRLDALPDDLAATVRSRVGYPVTTEEVLATPPLRDRWQVLGQVDSADDKVTTRRIWLRGAESGRFALVLAFAAPGQTFPADLVPGTEIDADLCFYPGALPLRALVATRHGAPVPMAAPTGAVDVRTALAAYSAGLAADPWRESVPVLLAGVVPTREGRLVDQAGDALPLAAGHDQPWWLLAGAGGQPVDLAAELGPAGLRPLAAWSQGCHLLAPAGSPAGADGHPAELPTELLSAALVGTARRPWDGAMAVGGRPLGAGGDGAAGVLEAAAVALTYRRAGATPADGSGRVPAAPAESRPPLPAPATVRLRTLLTDGGAPGGSQVQQELLTEWLRLADRHGGLVPADTLPALLDVGRRHRSLRPLLSRLGGRRGRWLAGLRSEWGYLFDEALDLAGPAGQVGGDDWTTGTTGERVAYLTRLRARDADAARELLAGGFAAESAPDRARFVETLEVGLCAADDAFLDGVLDDRRKEVRQAAVALLRQLPDSGLRRRMTARATAAVRLDASGGLTVDPPRECDPAMRRDGVDPQPPRGTGVAAWLLEQVLAGTPLATWTTAFARTPAEVVALATADDWGPALHRGWARAAVEERAGDWADALAAAVGPAGRQSRNTLPETLRWQLYEVLPAERLGSLVADALRTDPGRANRLLGMLTQDWSPELSGAVVDAVDVWARAEGRNSWYLAELCRIAGTAATPALADRVHHLTDELARDGVDPSRVRAVGQLAAVLAFRSEIHKEFR
ncbi:SWIM zinc finger family protein [Micromonospora sp. NPDC023956]|uniref:SWIM zinc finger family protein n=1 Tax=Micromonospora sp. NPDC023956 TaxID=3155722 RepID=UPI0033F447BD